MSTFENQEKIEKYLDELSDEYRTLLFNALIAQSSSPEDLNISDLLRLDNDVKKHLRPEYKKYEKKRKVLFIGGFSYMLLGIFIFLCFEISNMNYHSADPMSLVSLLLGFMGFIFCVLSFALPASTFSSKSRNANKNEELMSLLKYEAIAKWRDIEGLVNDLAVGERVYSPMSAIAYLSKSNLIDKEEQNMLRSLLKLRNEIAHSSDFTYSYDDVRKILNDAESVLVKLKKVLG